MIVKTKSASLILFGAELNEEGTIVSSTLVKCGSSLPAKVRLYLEDGTELGMFSLPGSMVKQRLASKIKGVSLTKIN